jgi:hypothetical protein
MTGRFGGPPITDLCMDLDARIGLTGKTRLPARADAERRLRACALQQAGSSLWGELEEGPRWTVAAGDDYDHGRFGNFTWGLRRDAVTYRFAQMAEMLRR